MAEMYRAAFEQATIGMALVAPDGRWLRANRTLCDLLGYTEAELLAAGFRPLITRDDAQGGDALARLLAGTGVTYEAEQRFHAGSSDELWLHLSVSLVRDVAGRPDFLIVQVQDITARLLAERERAAVLAQLRRSNQELERFAAIASHDLQEPLRKIQAFGDRLVATEDERLSARGRDYLARMHQAAGRMQELIGGLLAYSRVSSRPHEPVSVDLHVLVGEVLRDLEGQLARTAGRVAFAGLPTVAGDALLLRQLFQNLIANALKFHRPGVPPVVTIAADRADNVAAPGAGELAGPGWRIAVADNGIGFDAQYGERIFGMFQRLHGRGEYDGSGIGLALCRQIAERHGGHIDAAGHPGAGATFLVTLPIRDDGGGADGRAAPTDHDPAGR